MTSEYLMTAMLGPAGILIGAGATWFLNRSEWSRQKNWELKKSVVLDMVRALADLDGALSALSAALVPSNVGDTEEAKALRKSLQVDAMGMLKTCSAAYQRAHTVADLAIGGDFSKSISAYFQFGIGLAYKGLSQKSAYLSDKDMMKKLADLHSAVIIAARKALAIKDSQGLPVLVPFED